MVQVQKDFRLILNHHPVRSIKGSFAIFLLMSRPPLLARRGYARSAKYVIASSGGEPIAATLKAHNATLRSRHQRIAAFRLSVGGPLARSAFC